MEKMKMFTEHSFKIFEIEGLEPRMKAIRSGIQPIFQEIGNLFLTELSNKWPSQNFYLHIAQHRRRTTYAPENTWLAISTQKRGYKMEPHFQLGIWPNYVFVYLSIIDQPKAQQKYVQRLAQISKFPTDFVLSKNHTTSDFYNLTEVSNALERLKTVKKSEFEVGRTWSNDQFNGCRDEKLRNEMLKTLQELMPLYRNLMED